MTRLKGVPEREASWLARLIFRGNQIVELTTAIALENFRARFNRPFDIASENVSQGAFSPLPER